jgi:hypothetical protein
MSLWIWLLIVFIIWILYLEFSPRLGGIWLRPNSKGKKSISTGGILSLLGKPFTDKTYWYPRNWDLNIYMLWILTTIIYYLVTPLF